MRTILVIDDDVVILELLSAYLSGIGYRVITAPDGRKGLEAFHREPVDVVLCDLVMPGLGGLGVLAEVRKSSPMIPFVVFTGSNDVGKAVEALRLGAWDYLLKPLPGLDLLPPLLVRLEERATLLQEKELYQTRLEEQIRLRTSQLVRQLKEKDLLLAEVHHRVKNNLQVILVLLGWQKDHSQDPAVRTALEAHQSRLYALAMVQEEMSDPNRATLVNGHNYCAGLIHHLLSEFDLTSRVDLRLDLDDLALGPSQAFIVGLILNELVALLAQGDAPSSPWNLGVRLKATGPGAVELTVTESRGVWKRIVHSSEAHGLSWELVRELAVHHGGALVWTPEAPDRIVVRLA